MNKEKQILKNQFVMMRVLREICPSIANKTLLTDCMMETRPLFCKNEIEEECSDGLPKEFVNSGVVEKEFVNSNKFEGENK